VLQIENELNTSVEFELYAKECSSTSQARNPVRSYDTYGGSPWENIPDILRMYGMCSYHDWFEYLEFVNPSSDKFSRTNLGACSSSSQQQACEPATFDAFKAFWWDTRRPFATGFMPTLYETHKFQVHNFSSCLPEITLFSLAK
jgi:hypothetical protein